MLTGGHDAAVPWWRGVHHLHPAHWTDTRQAWAPVTTPAEDLVHGPRDADASNWLDLVIAGGSADHKIAPRL